MYQTEEEKVNIIQNQLSEGMRDIDTPISQDEFIEILDKKHKMGNFDRDLFNQLNGQLDKNNRPLTIRNFSDIWLQAQKRLENNMDNLEQEIRDLKEERDNYINCLLYTSPSPRDKRQSRMPSSA